MQNENKGHSESTTERRSKGQRERQHHLWRKNKLGRGQEAWGSRSGGRRGGVGKWDMEEWPGTQRGGTFSCSRYFWDSLQCPGPPRMQLFVRSYHCFSWLGFPWKSASSLCLWLSISLSPTPTCLLICKWFYDLI